MDVSSKQKRRSLKMIPDGNKESNFPREQNVLGPVSFCHLQGAQNERSLEVQRFRELCGEQSPGTFCESEDDGR